jgi:hypothetical protein
MCSGGFVWPLTVAKRHHATDQYQRPTNGPGNPLHDRGSLHRPDRVPLPSLQHANVRAVAPLPRVRTYSEAVGKLMATEEKISLLTLTLMAIGLAVALGVGG